MSKQSCDDALSVLAELGMGEWALEVSSLNTKNRFGESGFQWGETSLFRGVSYYFSQQDLSVVKAKLGSMIGEHASVCVLTLSGWAEEQIDGYQNIYVKDLDVCQKTIQMLSGQFDLFVLLPVVALNKDELTFPEILECMQSFLRSEGSGNPTVIYIDTQALDKKKMESVTATLNRYTEEKLK